MDVCNGPDPAWSWPPDYERRVQALSKIQIPGVLPNGDPVLIAPQSRQFRAHASTKMERRAYRGWLNALPVQHAIPGWQRISFVSPHSHDYDGAVSHLYRNHGYEGVVLPGGRLIFGRWFDTSNDDFPDFHVSD